VATSSRRLHEALTGIVRLTQQAGVHYQGTESSIAGSFNG